jgi:hypothetical protein
MSYLIPHCQSSAVTLAVSLKLGTEQRLCEGPVECKEGIIQYLSARFCAIKTALPKQIEWRSHKETVHRFVMCLTINFIVQIQFIYHIK